MTFFVGVDTGRHGALAVLGPSGRIVKIHDMPVRPGDASTGYYDPDELFRLFASFSYLPGVHVGIEWPQTRPGEGAQRSRNFGMGLAYLEMAAIANRVTYEKIDPGGWKGKMGIPGKTNPKAGEIARFRYLAMFPDQENLILGPRGGLKVDRVEAALVALYMYEQTAGGMRHIVDRFGKDSDQAAMLLWKGRPKRLRIT